MELARGVPGGYELMLYGDAGEGEPESVETTDDTVGQS